MVKWVKFGQNSGTGKSINGITVVQLGLVSFKNMFAQNSFNLLGINYLQLVQHLSDADLVTLTP